MLLTRGSCCLGSVTHLPACLFKKSRPKSPTFGSNCAGAACGARQVLDGAGPEPGAAFAQPPPGEGPPASPAPPSPGRRGRAPGRTRPLPGDAPKRGRRFLRRRDPRLRHQREPVGSPALRPARPPDRPAAVPAAAPAAAQPGSAEGRLAGREETGARSALPPGEGSGGRQRVDLLALPELPPEGCPGTSSGKATPGSGGLAAAGVEGLPQFTSLQ